MIFSHGYVSLWFWWVIFSYHFEVWKKNRERSEVMARSAFSKVLQKFPLDDKVHSLIGLHRWIQHKKSFKGLFIAHRLLMSFTFWIFYKCSCKSHMVALNVVLNPLAPNACLPKSKPFLTHSKQTLIQNEIHRN